MMSTEIITGDCLDVGDRPTKVTRPVLKYFGSGWTRGRWTVDHFPEHTVYCEPCFGAGNVFFQKRIAPMETVNDADNRVVNFFAVLRTRPDDLAHAIHLTPFHEGEYPLWRTPSDDPLEDARRFYFTCWGSIPGGPNPGPHSFRRQRTTRRWTPPTQDVADLSHLYTAAERLKNVVFERGDALSVTERMRGSGALIYFDPPYVHSTRVHRNGYNHEPDDDWHATAAELLRAHDGPVVVSGYRSALYAACYEAHGWTRVERTQGTNSGGKGVECLWLSLITQEIGRQRSLPLNL